MSKHKQVALEREEVFVLYFDGKPLYTKAGGHNDWRPPKKVYYTIGAAKCGVTNLPSEVNRQKITIRRYVPEVLSA